MSAFDNATLMITGGTGSFGSTVLKHFLDSDLKEIRIFSRDEKKQDDMRHELQANHPQYAGKVKFYIGDVRNPQSIRDAMPGVNYIFHAAALKQVPSCEFFPMQAVQTNIIGTDNVLHAAIDAGVERVVCLSTDKAAYPINAMGISKAMMEHVIYANARVAAERGGTTICCTRYGNVMCSRGSFTELLKTESCGQFSVNVSKPGITKGQHWHNTKWEFFIVVSGHGLIQERRVGSGEVLEFEVTGDKPQAIHMLPGYTHNIINLSETENLVTLMWANEQFDPAHPDTFFEKV